MPSASVSTATTVKPGFFRSWRQANFRSFIGVTESLFLEAGFRPAYKVPRHDEHRNPSQKPGDSRRTEAGLARVGAWTVGWPRGGRIHRSGFCWRAASNSMAKGGRQHN